MWLVIAAMLAALILLGALYEQNARRRDRQRTPEGRLVDVGGYRLHMQEMGEGGPTVVMIPGAAISSHSWAHMLRKASAIGRTVVYDRPGLGHSDPLPAGDARTPGERYVTELHALLQNAGIPGPYVLVGHSLGGLIARLYAIRYPDEVAGLVLVDSTHEWIHEDINVKRTFQAVGYLFRMMRALSHVGLTRFLGSKLGVMPMFPELALYRTQTTKDEFEAWLAAMFRSFAGVGVDEFASANAVLAEAHPYWKAASDGKQFGSLPLAVLTNPGFGQDWIEHHRELAGRSTDSVHHITEAKGHNVQVTSPDLVLKAIRHVSERAAARRVAG